MDFELKVTAIEYVLNLIFIEFKGTARERKAKFDLMSLSSVHSL